MVGDSWLRVQLNRVGHLVVSEVAEMLELRAREPSVCVLLYHSVPRKMFHGDHVGLTVPAWKFEEQMRFLFEEGYSVVPLEQAVAVARGEGDVPSRAVAITFDDGFLDNHGVAADILGKYRFTATIFVATDYLDRPRAYDYLDWLRHYGSAMGWEEARALRGRGISIASHGQTHRKMSLLSKAELEEELLGARARISEMLDETVDLVAYPFGGPDSFDSTTALVARSVGYKAGFSAISGIVRPGDDPFALRRYPILGNYDLSTFHTVVSGADEFYERWRCGIGAG